MYFAVRPLAVFMCKECIEHLLYTGEHGRYWSDGAPQGRRALCPEQAVHRDRHTKNISTLDKQIIASGRNTENRPAEALKLRVNVPKLKPTKTA